MNTFYEGCHARLVLYFRAHKGKFSDYPCLLAEQIRIDGSADKRGEFSAVTQRAAELFVSSSQHDLELVGYGSPVTDKPFETPHVSKVVHDVFGIEITDDEASEWIIPLGSIDQPQQKLPLTLSYQSYSAGMFVV